MSEKYIHYGHKHFDINLFCPVKNMEVLSKPTGVLWGSRTDAKYGWKEWNDDEQFRECNEENSFTFQLSNTARILTINSSDDLKKLAKTYRGFFVPCCLDFERLSQKYDAIEVNISSDRRLYWDLYGWDCDSILVMNPDVIREI